MDGGAGRSAPERGSVTGLVSHASRSRAQTVACRRRRAPGAVRSGVASGVGGDAWGTARGRPVPDLGGRCARQRVSAVLRAAGCGLGASGQAEGHRSRVGELSRERVDRMADTVALTVGAFDLRARLFDGRKMACPDLARGLIDVEERWMSYNVARKNAAALDSARNARDRSLYSDVDAVERRFERSKCARP